MDLQEESKHICVWVFKNSKLPLFNSLGDHQGLMSLEINIFLWRPVVVE